MSDEPADPADFETPILTAITWGVIWILVWFQIGPETLLVYRVIMYVIMLVCAILAVACARDGIKAFRHRSRPD